MTQDEPVRPAWRHVEACNNLASPAQLIAFRIGGEQVGWLGPELAHALAFFPRDVHFDGAGAALAGRLRGAGAADARRSRASRASLAGRGHFRSATSPSTCARPPRARCSRGWTAAPCRPSAIISQGVHVNGFVRRPDGPHLWVGWRSKHKPVAPGQMDNIVAGGIPAGLSAVRDAW